MTRHTVYLEVAHRRTFAGAIEWPGWTRGGRTEVEALEALLAAAPRFAKVAGGKFSAPERVSDFTVRERLAGGATTQFGAPGKVPTADERPLDATELLRQCSLLESAWKALDSAADAAAGATLRTGLRGGGRDIPKMLEHVLDAEAIYLVKLGARHDGAGGDHMQLRGAVREALAAIGAGREAANPSAVKRRWPPRYFVRRAAWHVLDHAWEIEDRRTP